MTKFNKSFFMANKSELLAGSLSWCNEEQRSGCAKHKRKVHADERCGNTEHVEITPTKDVRVYALHTCRQDCLHHIMLG